MFICCHGNRCIGEATMDIIKGNVTSVHMMELQVTTYLQSLFLKSLNASVVPRLWNASIEIMQAWRAWYFFTHAIT